MWSMWRWTFVHLWRLMYLVSICYVVFMISFVLLLLLLLPSSCSSASFLIITISIPCFVSSSPSSPFICWNHDYHSFRFCSPLLSPLLSLPPSHPCYLFSICSCFITIFCLMLLFPLPLPLPPSSCPNMFMLLKSFLSSRYYIFLKCLVPIPLHPSPQSPPPPYHPFA